MIAGRALVAALWVAALAPGCGGDDDGSVQHPDAAFVQDDGVPAADAPPGTPDGAPADAHAGCNARDLDPAWLKDYEQEVLGKIAGVNPIAPGVTLADRFSASNREATRVYLLAELTSMGYTPARHSFENGGVNIFARLGSGGRPVLVMGAHYDGIAGVHAAADDGTGTALVLAAARWFRDVDCLDHDVLFVFFDQEESGLVGSNYFAQKLIDDHETVIAVHSFDMISTDNDHDGAVELWEPSPGLADVYAAAVSSLQLPSRMPSPIEPIAHFSFSDHQSFLDRGFVATGVSEEFKSGDTNTNYHTPGDTYDNVNFDYLQHVSRVAFAAVSSQAAPNAP